MIELSHSCMDRYSRTRWVFGATLIAVYLFLSLALFSSLHKHNPNTAGIQCTLNNFEHQVAEGATAVVVTFLLFLIARTPLPANERKQSFIVSRLVSDRAPPVSLSL